MNDNGQKTEKKYILLQVVIVALFYLLIYANKIVPLEAKHIIMYASVGLSALISIRTIISFIQSIVKRKVTVWHIISFIIAIVIGYAVYIAIQGIFFTSPVGLHLN